MKMERVVTFSCGAGHMQLRSYGQGCLIPNNIGDCTREHKRNKRICGRVLCITSWFANETPDA